MSKLMQLTFSYNHLAIHFYYFRNNIANKTIRTNIIIKKINLI